MTTRADVTSYVAAVRAELADLEPDVIEELTGGLEADLTELAAESDTALADRVGAPDAYAAELRAAAGLESPHSRRSPLRAVPRRTGANLREAVESATRSLGSHRSWAQLREFLVVLIPAWWVLRAWVAYVLVERLFTGEPYGALPAGLEGWLVLVALVVLSVQLGRESDRSPRWLGRAVLVGNLAALVALPVAANELFDGVYTDFAYASEPTHPGLVLDGSPVTNIYAYGADGEPIYGVQLFTSDGVPLAIGEFDRFEHERRVERVLTPAVDSKGHQRWNVFPLGTARMAGGQPGTEPPDAAPRVPDWAESLRWFAQPREPLVLATTAPPETPAPPSGLPTTSAPALVPTPPPATTPPPG